MHCWIASYRIISSVVACHMEAPFFFTKVDELPQHLQRRLPP
jgi:hypothetical protein